MTNTNIKENEFGQVTKVVTLPAMGKDSLTLQAEVMECLIITHKSCSAEVSLYGGQVLKWKPTGEHDVFWLSDKAIFNSGKAIRGGIPLCWPWFGAYVPKGKNADVADNAIAKGGNHGFARQVNWMLEHAVIEAEQVKLTLTWTGENSHPLWPAKCALKQELIFGKKFSQTLFMTNLSDEPIEYTGALHSYFQVSSPSHVTIDNLAPIAFDDKISGSIAVVQTLDNCQGPIDRIYSINNVSDKRTMKIKDEQWQRTIEVTSRHCKQWVLWNPGKNIAQTMQDIHSGGEQEFVCLEAANTQFDIILPSETKVISQEVKLNCI